MGNLEWPTDLLCARYSELPAAALQSGHQAYPAAIMGRLAVRTEVVREGQQVLSQPGQVKLFFGSAHGIFLQYSCTDSVNRAGNYRVKFRAYRRKLRLRGPLGKRNYPTIRPLFV